MNDFKILCDIKLFTKPDYVNSHRLKFPVYYMIGGKNKIKKEVILPDSIDEELNNLHNGKQDDSISLDEKNDNIHGGSSNGGSSNDGSSNEHLAALSSYTKCKSRCSHALCNVYVV